MMFINPQIDYKEIHQLLNFTRTDRYPEIFDTCSKIKNGELNILSFGCSSGEECQTLRKYFPHAKIWGVDIDNAMLKIAETNNQDKNIFFSNEIPEIIFDFIFCMSVFCRHPATVEVDDCSRYYRFSLFENELDRLVNKLANDGCIIIYNSNFRFSDTKFFPQFSPIPTNDEHKSGFVIKFDRNHKKLYEQYYDCVFKYSRITHTKT